MGRAFEYRKAAKMKRWGNMSRVFPKLAKAITVAAKESGPDSATNAKLRTAIKNAKGENMPKDNIEAAIKRAIDKSMESMSEMNYEGKGPHGVLVYVECATDNPTRTIANVKSYFNKAGGSIVPNGSLEFMFNRKAVFEVEITEGMEFDLEELEFELIDAGLEDIEADDDIIMITGDYTNFGTLNSALEEKGYEIKKATLERFPTDPQEYTDEQMEEINKMLDKFEDDEDIQQMFTNIA